MLNKLWKNLIVIMIGVIILPIISLAQNININYALSNELDVQTSPTYPRPNSIVTIDLSLYTGDLNSAHIVWFQDGLNVSEGKGKTQYSFRTGAVGSKTEIEIIITLLEGVTFSKSITIIPASVDLVWEAISYTPPFYKGRALHPRQGSLKIIAMTEFANNGNRVSPANLVYKWSNDVAVYNSQSGYGKNILILDGSILGKSDNITVLVTDPTSGIAAQSRIIINPNDPEIVFYQNDPYYGYLFDFAINNSFNLSGSEVQILAAPYFFTKENDGVLSYVWRLNNQSVPELTNSRTVIFKKPEDKKGQSGIALQISNPNRILQEASNSLMIQFK